jgi:hypothetical protein
MGTICSFIRICPGPPDYTSCTCKLQVKLGSRLNFAFAVISLFSVLFPLLTSSHTPSDSSETPLLRYYLEVIAISRALMYDTIFFSLLPCGLKQNLIICSLKMMCASRMYSVSNKKMETFP